jgi:hypothetical protein
VSFREDVMTCLAPLFVTIVTSFFHRDSSSCSFNYDYLYKIGVISLATILASSKTFNCLYLFDRISLAMTSLY